VLSKDSRSLLAEKDNRFLIWLAIAFLAVMTYASLSVACGHAPFGDSEPSEGT
jgi:hypothetical protein